MCEYEYTEDDMIELESEVDRLEVLVHDYEGLWQDIQDLLVPPYGREKLSPEKICEEIQYFLDHRVLGL